MHKDKSRLFSIVPISAAVCLLTSSLTAKDLSKSGIQANGILTDQPDLAKQMKNAKPLKPEIVGPAARDIRLRTVQKIRNSKTGAYNIVLTYSEGDQSNMQFISIETVSREAKRTTIGCAPKRAEAQYKREGKPVPTFDINHIMDGNRGFIVLKDKLVYPIRSKYDQDVILCYDAPSNRLTVAAAVPDKGFHLVSHTYNREQNAVVGVGTTSIDKKWGLRCYRYYPATGEITLSPPYFTKVPKCNEYAYSRTRSIGNWVVSALGPFPWTVFAHNFRTGEWKTLMTFEKDHSHSAIRIHALKRGVFYLDNYTDRKNMKAWTFADGQLKKLDKTLPRKEWDVQVDSDLAKGSLDPEAETACPKLDVARRESLTAVSPENKVTIYWKNAQGQEESIQATVIPKLEPYFTLINCGRVLYGATYDHGKPIFYDLETKESRISTNYCSIYSLLTVGKRIYETGYALMSVRYSDLSKPGLQNIVFKPLGGNKQTRAHRPIAGIEAGADGNIYYAGIYWRQGKAGGMGWCNPETGKKGGYPMHPLRPFWMTSIQQGKYMILSSKGEKGGVLAVYDVMKKEMSSHEIPGIYPGYVVGVGEHIIGYGIQNDRGVVYRYDPISKTMIWQKEVEPKPVTARNSIQKRHFSSTYDGDTYVYFNGGTALFRVHKDTGWITVLGKTKAYPIIILDDYIYSAGYAGFARFKLPQPEGHSQ